MFELVIPGLILCLSIGYPLTETKSGDQGRQFETKDFSATAAEKFYRQIEESDLPFDAFKSAILVHDELAKKGQIRNTRFLTLIDFNQPSSMERLFVIDLVSKKVLFKSLVAHGKNSGENYAEIFSNEVQSHQSSLGFYLTGKSYQGEHGYSLILNGLEKGINDNARKRAVVIHGASYVSHSYIDSHGRLGRSFECPALPVETAPEIINTICDGSLLFIYAVNEDYRRKSSFFNSF
jgi:hypothetical protein